MVAEVVVGTHVSYVSWRVNECAGGVVGVVGGVEGEVGRLPAGAAFGCGQWGGCMFG